MNKEQNFIVEKILQTYIIRKKFGQDKEWLMMSSIMPYIIDDEGDGEFEKWLRNNPMPTKGIDDE